MIRRKIVAKRKDTLSSNIQLAWEGNITMPLDDMKKMFPSANKHQITYARDAVLKRRATAGKMTKVGTKRAKSSAPPPPPRRKTPAQLAAMTAACNRPHFTGPLKDTETVFDRLMAIEERMTGEDIRFSSEDVVRILQLASDETTGLLRQMRQQ
jgi:hypothetical protein